MTDPMIKLYAGLTHSELAVLNFGYLMKGDDGDLERKRIESVMTDEYFVGLPMEFRRIEYNLKGLAMIYAVTYWRQVALCQALMGGAMAKLRSDDPEAYQPMAQRSNAAEAALLAIEHAFDDVCLEHGLDPSTMRTLSGKRFYEVANNIQPDESCLSSYREIFAGVMA